VTGANKKTHKEIGQEWDRWEVPKGFNIRKLSKRDQIVHSYQHIDWVVGMYREWCTTGKALALVLLKGAGNLYGILTIFCLFM
jgi:hypothetical protein